jgi:ribonucleoside-diphosphate reductase alpha chain
MAEVKTSGSIGEATWIPADVREVFVTAHDLSVEDHVRIQSAFQECTDLAVAKTVNLPSWATSADVRRAFELAHQRRCKGVTCFRDGCRETSFLAASTAARCAGPDCSVC